MQYKADSPEAYIAQVPEERKAVLEKLRKTILNNLPKGFEEGIQYGMIGYYVPHSLYPDGYHTNPKEPLPFMHIASQKNFIALYHSGIYAQKELLDWFTQEYPSYSQRKLDMGKSCIRFKHIHEIPYELIAQLTRKITPDEWVTTYESVIKNRKK